MTCKFSLKICVWLFSHKHINSYAPHIKTIKRHMKNGKDKIRRHLMLKQSTFEDHLTQISQKDFDRILDSTDNCSMITIKGDASDILKQLHDKLNSLPTRTNQDIVMKIGHNSDAWECLDILNRTLTIIQQSDPQANITWEYSQDRTLDRDKLSLRVLIAEPKIR